MGSERGTVFYRGNDGGYSFYWKRGRMAVFVSIVSIGRFRLEISKKKLDEATL